MPRARLLSCVGKCVTCKQTFNYDVVIVIDRDWETHESNLALGISGLGFL